jgi:hypothetical protein
MSSQILLSGGDKYYSYSGVLFGDVSAPATIQTNFIPNTGLRDSLVSIQPFFGNPVNTGSGNGLGIIVKLDDVEIFRNVYTNAGNTKPNFTNIQLFIPRQSKLEILSLNNADNNTQLRGANLLGYYL